MAERLDCLPPEEIGAFAEGGLAEPRRAAAVAHLASCEACRQALAGTLDALEGLREGAGDAREEAAAGEPAPPVTPFPRQPRRSWAPWWAVAAGLLLVSALVVHQLDARRSPPNRQDWLAQQPAAEQLVPLLWGGVVVRGDGGARELRRASAEVGALLVDLEVALAAADGAKAGDLAHRLAVVCEQAGLLEAEVAALREAARSGSLDRLRAAVARVEPRARQRFVPLYVDLGAFVEQARVAGLAGSTGIGSDRHARRYLEWVLSQDEEELSPELRRMLEELGGGSPTAAEQAAAAHQALRELTR